MSMVIAWVFFGLGALFSLPIIVGFVGALWAFAMNEPTRITSVDWMLTLIFIATPVSFFLASLAASRLEDR